MCDARPLRTTTKRATRKSGVRQRLRTSKGDDAEVDGDVVSPEQRFLQAMQGLGEKKGWDASDDLASLGKQNMLEVEDGLDPLTARESIEMGLETYQEKDYEGALALFRQALTLPGTGIKRDKKKPNELSVGERYSALYNIACCQAQLGMLEDALDTLASCMEAGYEDYENLRQDPDLEPLRTSPEFEELIETFEPKGLAKQFDLKESVLYRFFNR